MINKIITSGEKLKNLRKEYGIKQHQLCGDKITRNMISMIENNKSGLTENTAKLIVDNINRICSEKGIDSSISIDYLLESVDDQAKKIVHDYICKLHSHGDLTIPPFLQDQIEDIQLLVDKYRLSSEKIIIFTHLATIYKNIKDYHNAYTYYIRAFESHKNLFNNKNLISILINIVFCCNNLHEYKQAMYFNKLAYIYMNDLPSDLEYKLRFNNLISLKNLQEYDSVLKELQYIDTNFSEIIEFNLTEKVDLMILKANCFKEKCHFTDSIRLHNAAHSLTQDTEVKLVCLCNLLEIYVQMKDSHNIRKYLERTLILMNDYDSYEKKSYAPEILNDIALSYYELGDLESCKQYLLMCISESKNSKKAVVIEDALCKLLDINIMLNSHEDVGFVKNLVLEALSLNLLKVNSLSTLKLLRYFNKIGDSTSIDDFITFIESIR